MAQMATSATAIAAPSSPVRTPPAIAMSAMGRLYSREIDPEEGELVPNRRSVTAMNNAAATG
jgi:hypothetical protein